jgi:hypothetical protein
MLKYFLADALLENCGKCHELFELKPRTFEKNKLCELCIRLATTLP